MISRVCDGDFDIFSMFHAHLHLQNGSMANNSVFVQCPIDILYIDWVFQSVGGDLVFVNERFVTVDTLGSTV
jgi:hypothetical protein